MAQPTTWPTDGWPTSSPEEVGLLAEPLHHLDRDFGAGKYGYVDRLVVVRQGRLVMNKQYENDYREISRGFSGALGCGYDTCEQTIDVHLYNYYHPEYHPFYRGRDVHTLQSVTKSVAATVLGVALGRGAIAGTEAPLLSFFDDYDLSRVDDRLAEATLDDLLTMRSGIEWHESDRPLDETNTVLQMEWSSDWIQFVLDRPSDAVPGEKWVYNSGGSQLMSGIIEKATGSFIDEYAERHFFGPLGIRDLYWKKTPTGYPDTEGGLYLEAEQLAKIGYLYLHDGIWDSKRILPEGWVAQATRRHAENVNDDGWGYGYQWWRIDRDGLDIWAALGFGEQLLVVIPEHELIGVVNSWNIFGGRRLSTLGGLLDALIASAGS